MRTFFYLGALTAALNYLGAEAVSIEGQMTHESGLDMAVSTWDGSATLSQTETEVVGKTKVEKDSWDHRKYDFSTVSSEDLEGFSNSLLELTMPLMALAGTDVKTFKASLKAGDDGKGTWTQLKQQYSALLAELVKIPDLQKFVRKSAMRDVVGGW